MNELQQTEFNMLKVFMEICEKWNLKYFLACGSVLGSVKYKGFIPWDDDVDVCLFRDDYERFLEIAQNELPQWCFLQNYKTDPKFPHTYSKLRDSRTTFIEKGVAKLHINHGVFVDIFPIDGYPKNEKEIILLNKRKKALLRKIYCALDDKSNYKVRIRNFVFKLLGFHKITAKTIEKLENLYKQYPTKDSEILCNHGNWQGALEYAPAWYYGEGIFAEFEGLKVRIPENFDAYLTQKYGEWRKDPEISKQKSNHNVVRCDINKSYLEYLK